MIPRAYQTDSERAPWNESEYDEPDPDRVYEREAEKRIEQEARHVTGEEE